MEQTGHYGDTIAATLHQLSIHSLHLVNPQRIKAFGMQKLRRNKSDTADAKIIASIIRSNPKLLAKSKLLKTIPGIAEVASQIVIAELPDLDEFEDACQLAAWCGHTPSHYQSGTSGRTRTPITKIASVRLRRSLFMPVMTARTFNPLLKTFADRLIENGKKPKEVIIAVMRKLLHQIYGILKSGQPYNPEKRGFAGT